MKFGELKELIREAMTEDDKGYKARREFESSVFQLGIDHIDQKFLTDEEKKGLRDLLFVLERHTGIAPHQFKHLMQSIIRERTVDRYLEVVERIQKDPEAKEARAAQAKRVYPHGSRKD